MLSGPLPQVRTRRDLWIVAGIWLAVSILMIWLARVRIGERIFSDPDDAMRLLQVRDLLSGQSWFDVTQYRLNPPAGGPMHWTRWVDLPIAAVILLVRPLLGQQMAEMAALIIVPLLTLGAAMLLMYRLSSRLLDRSAAFFAVLALPASLGALTQMRILRIDHHGWQIVLALAAMIGVLDERPRRSGLIAGLAAGLWLNISLEGLPFTAALGAWFGLRWLANPAEADRLKAFLAALAGAGTLLFAIDHPVSSWTSYPHDALNGAHLAAFAAAWLCCQLVVRPTVRNPAMRFGILTVAGIIALGTMFAVDPNVLQPPFASLDPIVNAIWYRAIEEGQPIWHLPPREAAGALAQPLVGLFGALFAVWKCPADARPRWIAYAYFAAVAAVEAVLVIREATAASIIALPGTAFLCDFALRRARKVPLTALRIPATAGALCLMMPAYVVPAVLSPENPDFKAAADTSQDCTTRSEVEKLRALPPGILGLPLDITPPILVATEHKALAGGYHRNVQGIHDAILLFVGKAAVSRQVLARRHIDYVVFCPRTAETMWWASNNQRGLAAQLNAGKAPEWLQPVKIPGLHALKVYRVRKDLLAKA